jgi:transcriptional regulator with XRE-family HTH domain
MRDARGISLRAAAEVLGTERHATISEIESGKRTATFAEIVKLAAFYGVTLSDVLAATSGEAVSLDVSAAFPRADGELTESDRIALSRMERVARDYVSLKVVLGS